MVDRGETHVQTNQKEPPSPGLEPKHEKRDRNLNTPRRKKKKKAKGRKSNRNRVS